MTYGKVSVLLPLAMAAAAILGGCREDLVWTHTAPLPTDAWTPERPVVFELDPEAYVPKSTNRFAEYTSKQLGDTVVRLRGTFEALLCLRYTRHANAAEVSVEAERVSLDAPFVTDTVTFRLFDAQGQPTGHGRLGIYEVTVPLPSPLRVTEGTTVNITPLPYTTPPSGLSSLSMLLRPLPPRSSGH